MKQRILFVMHQETSDPGRIGRMVKASGYEADICRPPCGDTLPESLDDFAATVMFGGPMSANDDHLPFIKAELDWLDIVLQADKPFLGICLGAQLLARQLGGEVYHHEDGYHEIGFYEVNPGPDGGHLFDDGQYFYQWHSEGFTLPSGVAHLASSEWFPNQAFRVGNCYGVQFHPDVTGEMLARWCTMVAHRMVLPGAQARDRQHAGHAAYGNQVDGWARRFFAHWLDQTHGETDLVAMAGSD